MNPALSFSFQPSRSTKRRTSVDYGRYTNATTSTDHHHQRQFSQSNSVASKPLVRNWLATWATARKSKRRVGLVLLVLGSLMVLWIVFGSGSTSTTGSRLRLPPRRHSQEAIVTVFSSDIYLPGALVLGHSLQPHRKSRPLIALVPTNSLTSPVSHKLLEKIGWKVVEVDPIALPGVKEKKVDWRFADMLTKLYAFVRSLELTTLYHFTADTLDRLKDMTEYQRIALVDADAYLVGPIEEPFSLMKQSSAPLAASMPATKPVLPFLDQFAGHFNGGLMVIKPDAHTYKELLALSQDGSYYDISLAEQNLLNKYFAGEWLGLPSVYNLLYMYHGRSSYWSRLRAKASLIHFAGGSKPWQPCHAHASAGDASSPKADDCDHEHEEIQVWRLLFKEMLHKSGQEFNKDLKELMVDLQEVGQFDIHLLDGVPD